MECKARLNAIDFPNSSQRPKNSQSREIILFALCEILRWAAAVFERGRAHALVHLWNAAEVYCTRSLLLSLTSLPLPCLHNSQAACTQAHERKKFILVCRYLRKEPARAEYGSKKALMIASTAYGAQSFCRGTFYYRYT